MALKDLATLGFRKREMSLHEEFHNNHRKYNNLVHDLFQSIDHSIQNKPSTDPATILTNIITVDTEMKRVVSKIYEHQQIQENNSKLETECETIKSNIINSVLKLDKLSLEMKEILNKARKSVNHYQCFVF
jgi:hypothetical protein